MRMDVVPAGNVGEVVLDHLEEALWLLRVSQALRHDQGIPLRAG